MTGLYWLIRKDISIFFSDVSGALMTIVMPAALAILLGSIFQPPGDMGPISVLLIDEDAGPVGQTWAKQLNARPDLEVQEVSRDEAVSLVGRGLAPIAVFIPEDASEQLTAESLSSGVMPRLGLLEDPARQVEGMRVRGVLTEVSVLVVGKRLAEPRFALQLIRSGKERLKGLSLLLSSTTSGHLQSMLTSAEQVLAPYEKVPILPIPFPQTLGEWVVSFDAEDFPRELGEQRQGYHSYSHAFAGMICMFLLFFGLERSKQDLRERKDGTQFRITTTPVSHGAIMMGSWLSTSFIALLSALITYLIGWVTVDVVVHGSILGFCLLLLGMSWMVGGFSLLMSNLCKTNQALTSIGTLCVLVMSFVGGAWAPSFVLSEVLQTLGLWMPTSWATDGLAATTWRGLGLSASAGPALALFGFGALFGGLAWGISWRRSHP